MDPDFIFKSGEFMCPVSTSEYNLIQIFYLKLAEVYTL